MRRFGDGGELVVNVMIGTIVVNVRFVDSGELMNLGIWYRMRVRIGCLQRHRTLEKANRLMGCVGGFMMILNE
jgi:hypothetical protein